MYIAEAGGGGEQGVKIQLWEGTHPGGKGSFEEKLNCILSFAWGPRKMFNAEGRAAAEGGRLVGPEKMETAFNL